MILIHFNNYQVILHLFIEPHIKYFIVILQISLSSHFHVDLCLLL